MDSVPTEIWEHIARFACSDNGFTGRALSLVCREMHAIVEPYKLRSISIVGGAQIVKFSEFLASISTTTITPRTAPQTTICNLFIGITNPRRFPSLTASSDLLLRAALNSLSLLNDPTMPSPTPPPTFGRQSLDGEALIIVKAVYRILSVVAPTLHTLHLHFTFETLSSTPFPFPMPRLSELTVYGPLLNSHTGDISSTISLLTIFPSLKRLRMGNFQGLPTDYLPRLAISMPQLTHISLFQPLPSTHHVHSLGRLIMSPEMFWPGEALTKIIIEVDINSVVFQENTTNNGVDRERRKPMQWLKNLRDCVCRTADTRVRLIETHRSWVDIETAQIEWSKRNMGTEWAATFRN
jgi:hypothetical protein